NLLGTTYAGGRHLYGVVFKLAPDGAYQVLHSFNGPPGGYRPTSGVTVAGDGTIYGTTTVGGVNSCSGHGVPTCGTVFKLTESGSYLTLHSFKVGFGIEPTGGVIIDGNANIFGTTGYGGTIDNLGVVFEITSDGAYRVLHNFADSSPSTTLTFDGAGNL